MTIEDKIKRYQMLIGDNSKEAEKEKEAIVKWLEENGTQEAKDAAERLIIDNLQRIDGEVLSIRHRLGDVYDLIPISYIAEHYYGKSPAWLYQRINGNKVRGRVYSLNDEQREIFNKAMGDIARLFSQIRV